MVNQNNRWSQKKIIFKLDHLGQEQFNKNILETIQKNIFYKQL